ncbi:MAG: helix-turn-helix domain-containing protein [Acidimicrobiales bacterium]
MSPATTLLRTSDFPAQDRADYWRSAVSDVFVPMEVVFPDDGYPNTKAGFSGRILSRSLGRIQVADVLADAHCVNHSSRDVALSEVDSYKLSMPLRGDCLVIQDEREARVKTGDLVLYETDRPYQIAFDDVCELLVIMFPRRDLRLPPDLMNRVIASSFSGKTGVGAIVSAALSSFSSNLGEISEAQASPLADNLIDLFTTLFAEWLGGCVSGSSSAQMLLLATKAFIAANLGDPNLTPNRVAQGVSISTGYLHKLFRLEGTSVSRYIRERRLERCRHDLSDPADRFVPVSAVGARWGLVDPAHFSRLFKAAYGLAPREFRLSCQGQFKSALVRAESGQKLCEANHPYPSSLR